jgi:hypothetical protein
MVASSTASSTPSFDLHVSSGGVTHLAVGEKVQFRAYLPEVRRPEGPVLPLAIPLVWRVEPAGVATITPQGLLTALAPGYVQVHVDDARKIPPDSKELPAGLPGRRALTIVKELSGGRLPRFTGAREFERFALEWDQSGYARNEGLSMTLQTFEWSAGITTKGPPSGRLPWILEAVAERSQFNDERGYRGVIFPEDQKRWRENLTSARLTISSWKDGVASGRFEMKTTRGVDLDFVFHAAFSDRGGALARAAASGSSGK